MGIHMEYKLGHNGAMRLFLVGGAITILKNMKVNRKDDIPYMKWTNKKCSKPPTRFVGLCSPHEYSS
jgi:hypothetical protein